MSDLKFIDLSERMYKYTRTFSIKSIEDAMVELITNCIDAYNSSNIINNRQIFIECYLSDGIIKVRDYASGLDGNKMCECFLQVGNYTNSGKGNRGFFSRGAKDISSIGDITFTAIKDDKMSQIFLNRDAYGKMEMCNVDVDVTLRRSVKIPDPFNGLEVSINLMNNFIKYKPEALANSLCKLCTLRDIMSNDANNITFTSYDAKGTILFSKKLYYEYLPADLLLRVEYKVPQYEYCKATLTVYKTLEPIENPYKENELEFGFLIKDSSTIYEVNTIDSRFRWNPSMPYIYGSLVCEEISKLLIDYDINGSSELNPFPVIDPTRVTGVNLSHPFIISLLSIPKVRIDQILRDLNRNISSKSITLDDANQLFKDLSDFALDHIPSENVALSLITNYDGVLAKAVEDDRMNYVTSEQSMVLSKEYNVRQTETNQYIDEIIKQYAIKNNINPSGYYFFINPDNTVIAIPGNVLHDQTKIIEVLEILEPGAISNMAKQPFVYTIDNNGKDLIKLYIYEKGELDYITNPSEEYVIAQNKSFTISFFNDININKRYVIDYSNGVNININLNDHGVQKYLSNCTNDIGIEAITHINSISSLIFFKELMISAFCDIITDSSTMSGELVLESGDNYNNMRKILEFQNKIISNIHPALDNIFQKYVDNTIESKFAIAQDAINHLSTVVANNIDMNGTIGDNLRIMKANLLDLIHSAIM